MVITDSLPWEVDVAVVGGGPAGLAAALAARRSGLSVVVADQTRPPIDKACGEGLMPDGVAALRQLGVALPERQGRGFRGIRFIEGALAPEALFPGTGGVGIARTALHRLLLDHARDAGAVVFERTRVEGMDRGEIRFGGRRVRCRWIVGADGLHSHVRAWAGLDRATRHRPRIGVRQRFRVRPWTDLVEVHWHAHGQAYVTPTSAEEVNVALVSRSGQARFRDLSVLFPALATRLEGAETVGPARGASTLSCRLLSVTDGRVALIGDASGSVDAITGDGLSLAFRQAVALGAAFDAGELGLYAASHARLARRPRLMERLLLLMSDHPKLRRRILQALMERPRTFERCLAVHVGGLGAASLWWDLAGVGPDLVGPRRRVAG